VCVCRVKQRGVHGVHTSSRDVHLIHESLRSVERTVTQAGITVQVKDVMYSSIQLCRPATRSYLERVTTAVCDAWSDLRLPSQLQSVTARCPLLMLGERGTGSRYVVTRTTVALTGSDVMMASPARH